MIETANCEVTRSRRKNRDRREVGNLKTRRWREWFQLLADTMLSTWCTENGVVRADSRLIIEAMVASDGGTPEG